MRTASRNPRDGFSLVELVVVIVIIGILAAVAIPRFSRGTSGAGKSAAQYDLALVRNALILYYEEHGRTYPGPDEATMTAQLTQYSDVSGNTAATKDATHKFGPYLLRIPPCPVGENAGSNGILFDATNSPPVVDTSGGQGWLYNPNTGEFLINSAKADEDGTPYNTY